MPKRNFTVEKLARMETSVRWIRRTNGALCVILAISCGLVIAATAVPQKREYEKLRAKLSNTQLSEKRTLAVKDYKQIELRALREDKSYLEIHARDRLNYYLPGERVLRFESDR